MTNDDDPMVEVCKMCGDSYEYEPETCFCGVMSPDGTDTGECSPFVNLTTLCPKCTAEWEEHHGQAAEE